MLPGRATHNMRLYRITTPGRIAGAYAALAGTWILASDSLLGWVGLSGGDKWYLGLAKGLLFVGVTTALLYFLVRRMVRRQAAVEAARRESDARWIAALDAAGDGIWDWNLQTGDTFFSPCCKAMLGLSAADILPRIEEWRSRVHPDDQARVEEELQRHLRGESPVARTEHRMRAADGSYKWLQTRGKIIERTEDGRPRRMLGVVSDVSELRAAQERASDALTLSNTILQSSPVGVISYRTDGQTVSANEAAARIVGATVPALLAQNFRQIASWREYGLLAAAERALAEEREVELTTPLHTTFGRDVRVALRFAPFRHQGELRLLLILIDETEKHRQWQELQLARAALQASPAAWVITDPAGRIEWVNPAFTRQTGYPAAEAIGRTPRLLKSGLHPPEFYQQLWATILRGEVWDGEMRNRRKDGTLYHERSVIAPVRGPDGAVSHFVAVKLDVTAERELEQQLNRVQRLESIGMLASGIAHDLNNVLAPIVLSMELLKMKCPQPDALAALRIVEQSAQRGVGIVRQVLTFARGVDGERGEVPTRHLVRDVAQLIEETFPRNIRVSTQLAADLGAIRGDVTQLHQVLLNLAVNARDAMPEGGTITLQAHHAEVDETIVRRLPALRPGPHVLLRVADTGTGIPPDVIEHIFEPFFTTKPRGKGTGLGLSTVHGIVRSHGGAIEVRSTPGSGTEFLVWLPRLVSPAAGEAPSAAAPPTLWGAGRRVLLVDDEPAVLRVTAEVLERHGFNVVAAGDGAAGMAAFQRGGPWHLALLDRMMPQLDGVSLAAAIRRTAPQLPVILMSGVIDEPLLSSGSAPPVHAVADIRTQLAKPFTEDQLLTALRRELDGAREST
jgi:two-component system cell cycle sensor histidine kinase/response regulator CckA